MKTLPSAVLLAILAMAGAAVAADDAAPAHPASRSTRAPKAPAPQPAQMPARPAPRSAPLPASVAAEADVGGEVSIGQVVYQVLLGEIGLGRGQTDLAVSAYTDLALRTKDPQVLARAIEVASYGRRFDLAYDLAQRWVAQEPNSVPARQALAGLMVVNHRIDDLAPQLLKLFAQDKDNLPDDLMRLNRMFSRYPDKSAVLRLVEQVAQPYPKVAEAHYAVAQAALAAGDRERAREAVHLAQELRPDWELAALLDAQIVATDSPTQALSLLEAFLARNPGAKDVRLQLARAYVAEKRYGDANAEFRRLLRDYPDAVEVIYPVAILALQQNDLVTAEAQLKRLLALGVGDQDAVHFYLGQVAEVGQRDAEAMEHYAQVNGGEYFVNARGRQAQILAHQGKLAEARELLRGAAVAAPREGTALLLAEAQLLRDAKRPQEAFDLLEAQLKKQPANPEILYDSALLADRLDRVELVEERLRKLIQLQPESAHAYNALGYTFAERGLRLNEARELVARALALAPEDPFIIDSMGWVLYRQGDLDGALSQLQKAYGLRQDPEIAAHLGEVLWAANRKDEARRTWQEAAKRDPDNEALAAVMKKYLP